MRVRIVHLYPDLMDLYGDTGNVLALRRRCEWRGIDVEITPVSLDTPDVPDDTDILVIGGGQDTAQRIVAEDLQRHGTRIRALVDRGTAALAVCGGFQLFGTGYETASGLALPGIGVFDARTVAGEGRLVGDVVAEVIRRSDRDAVVRGGLELVGFENHAGRTLLGPMGTPFARVLSGMGNTGDGSVDGAVYKNAVGTYLHGPVLPKNPALADALIHAGLCHRYGAIRALATLDDSAEAAAHRSAAERALTRFASARRSR